MSRPRVFDSEDLADKLDIYVQESDDPMVQEFCLLNKVSKDTIYRLVKESKRLADSIKMCHLKQEIRTQRKVEQGEMNPSFGIFKLKQKCYGWTDKQETVNTNLNIEGDMTEEEADEILKKAGVKVDS